MNTNEQLMQVIAWLIQEYEEGEGTIPDGLYNAAKIAIKQGENK
jgi:hypothetical protein